MMASATKKDVRILVLGLTRATRLRKAARPSGVAQQQAASSSERTLHRAGRANGGNAEVQGGRGRGEGLGCAMARADGPTRRFQTGV